MINEALIKAGQTAELLRSDLLEALKHADPVTALVLSPLIGRAASNDISALFEARNARP